MALILILAYCLGSVPFALLLARQSGGDLRRIGSGNLGAANVLRASGVRAGVIVALLDIGKGAASVALAMRLSADARVPAAAGLAAIVGHIYPVWLRFKGGKGVATACGVFSVLTPLAALPAFLVFLTTAWTTRYISLGSVLATVVLPPVAYATGASMASLVAAGSAAMLILFRHRGNLMRLWAGTERRFGARA
jgi:glycerol-3-phosphate acyltransferase PlsY